VTDPPSTPTQAKIVREAAQRRPPALVHAGWARAFPWLVQGTTTRGRAGGFDLGLFSAGSPGDQVRANWAELAEATGFDTVVHAHQLHGSDIRVTSGGLRSTEGAGRPGEPEGSPSQLPTLLEAADGHVTDQAGVLLAVTTADCVPVFLVDSRLRAIGVVHAGWRGVAAGILERGLETMHGAFETRPSDVWLHLGPAICGGCYEVGPEVFEALGQKPPVGNEPIDVRSILRGRAGAAGVPAERISVSSHCTRCTDSGLYSHRVGHAQRQVGFIGIRAADPS